MNEPKPTDEERARALIARLPMLDKDKEAMIATELRAVREPLEREVAQWQTASQVTRERLVARADEVEVLRAQLATAQAEIAQLRVDYENAGDCAFAQLAKLQQAEADLTTAQERIRYLTEEAYPADRRMWEHGVKRAEEQRDRITAQLATERATTARLTEQLQRLAERIVSHDQPCGDPRHEVCAETCILAEAKGLYEPHYKTVVQRTEADLTAAQATVAGLLAALEECAAIAERYEAAEVRWQENHGDEEPGPIGKRPTDRVQYALRTLRLELNKHIEQALTDSASLATAYTAAVQQRLAEQLVHCDKPMVAHHDMIVCQGCDQVLTDIISSDTAAVRAPLEAEIARLKASLLSHLEEKAADGLLEGILGASIKDIEAAAVRAPLEAEVARLREALLPFAMLADEADQQKRDLHYLPCSARIAELRDARQAVNDSAEVASTYRAQVRTEAREETSRPLRAALERYGRHESQCRGEYGKGGGLAAYDTRSGYAAQLVQGCTCGLAEALAGDPGRLP